MTAIFANENEESASQTVRQTMSVGTDDSGVPTVSFATNRGKGSGSQSLPASEFGEVVSLLQDYAKNGLPETSEESLSAADSIRRTISISDGVVSFRVRGGKGSKPAKINLDEFADVVELLASTNDAVAAAADSLSESSS
jgi:hypothetical protein